MSGNRHDQSMDIIDRLNWLLIKSTNCAQERNKTQVDDNNDDHGYDDDGYDGHLGARLELKSVEDHMRCLIPAAIIMLTLQSRRNKDKICSPLDTLRRVVEEFVKRRALALLDGVLVEQLVRSHRCVRWLDPALHKNVLRVQHL